MSAINLEKTYPSSKEEVWKYLVNDELLSTWCMPAKGFSLDKGKEFLFEMAPSVFWDGKFYNKVMDFEENNFISYECISKRPRLSTVVKWTLSEENGKTMLSLEHSGFRGFDWLTKTMLAAGWKKMMNENLYNKLTE